MWGEGQKGTSEVTLGTIDLLLIGKCIMDEVKEHNRLQEGTLCTVDLLLIDKCIMIEVKEHNRLSEGKLGTVDLLLIDKCIMDEVKEHNRNLAVAYYDYQKACDRVHHDWTLKVYR